jgi:hypothetical protein
VVPPRASPHTTPSLSATPAPRPSSRHVRSEKLTKRVFLSSPTTPVARHSRLESPPPHVMAEIDLKLLMTQLEYHRSEVPTDPLFPVTAFVAHYWAHHTQYMDWMRDHGSDSWTGDIGAMSGGSGDERQRRRGAEGKRDDEALNEAGRGNESDE